MKKIFLVTLLLVSILTMTGFSTVEAGYWEDAKQMYEWNGIQGETEVDLKVVTPDGSYQYKINMNTKSNLKDFSSYAEIKVENVLEPQDIPTIKMYTHGSNLYINKDAVLSLLSTMGMAEAMEIQEEYVMLESGENTANVNINVLNDMIAFIEEMDLGIELNMVQDGNTYTLTLGSDEMIDLLDAYIRYIITNMDKLPKSFMQPEMTLTEEEVQEALEGYNTFVVSYKEMAKQFIAGSQYNQESTFDEGKYEEKINLIFTTPMGSIDLNTISTSTELTSFDIELPESVMTITEEEFTALMMGQFATGANTGMELKAIIELDGSYLKLEEYDLQEGSIALKIVEGTSYITAADAQTLLDVTIEEETLPIRDLENYGFYVHWNPENATIEIYK